MIIGAMKSGTTSLYSYIKQHPNIFMTSIKEPMFFNNFNQKNNYFIKGSVRNKINTLSQYYELFNSVKNEDAIGEASPTYLYNHKCPEIINKYLPNLKIIISLRQPAQRAYSNYLHSIRSGREPIKNFEKAIKEEEERIKNNWNPLYHYKNQGLYFNQLNRYYKIFSPENIHIIIFEEFIKNPQKTTKEIFNFLNVDSSFNINYKAVKNKSGIPKGFLGWIVQKARFYNIMPKIELSKYLPEKIILLLFNLIYSKPNKLNEELKNHLTNTYFREDIIKLEKLIKKDLHMWL